MTRAGRASGEQREEARAVERNGACGSFDGTVRVIVSHTNQLSETEAVMNGYQERVIQSFRRVQGWFVANPEYVAANPKLGMQVDALNGIVSRLSDHAVVQNTQHAQSLLISKDELEKRHELVAHYMAPIVKVARALRGTVPGIGVLSLPKGNASKSEVITAANAMAEKAETYKDVLLESGLPADFIEQLKQAAAALKGSLDDRGLARAGWVAATKGVRSELALGRRVVTILDAVVTHLVRSDPVKLAEWEQLKRVTVKGVAGHSSAAVVESGSTPIATSSADVAAGSAAVVKAA